jgi:hypothetical protein
MITKNIIGRWQDENKNTWGSIHTQKNCEEFSKSLINCNNCNHCNNCNYCNNCNNCNNCYNCNHCNYCTNCYDCNYCNHCYNCYYCNNFRKNPARILSKPIGSRGQQTTIYWLDKQTQIVCECFKGTLEEFEQKVKETHVDNLHGKDYMALIAIAKQLIVL